jgi:hypothetical protein
MTPTSPEHGSLHVRPYPQHAPKQGRETGLTEPY